MSRGLGDVYKRQFIHYTAIAAELIGSPATIIIFYQFVFDDVEDDEDEPSDFA